jgi:hypothetical protein
MAMFVINSTETLTTAIRTELDKMYSFSMEMISDAEIRYYVPKAMTRCIREPYEQWLTDQNEKTFMELEPFIRVASVYRNSNTSDYVLLTTPVNNITGYCYNLPSDALYTISEMPELSSTARGRLRSLIRKTVDTYIAELLNPMSDIWMHDNKMSIIRVPIKNQVWYYGQTGGIVGDFTAVKLTYVCNLLYGMNSSSDLYSYFAKFPIYLQDKIVSMSVGMLLEVMADPRFQTYASIEGSIKT